MIGRILSALGTWPSVRDWTKGLAISIVTIMIIAAVAGLSGLLEWQHDMAVLARLPLILIVPAFSEELVFRAPVPARGQTRYQPHGLLRRPFSSLQWHVLEAKTFLPGARLFLTAPFLACAAVLGLGCALLKYRTGSLWPPVVLHALVVWVWQSAFGGPSVAELMRG